MANKEEAQSFRKSMPEEPSVDQFAIKFLSKRLIQYRNIKIGRADNPLYAKADVYRKLRDFQKEVDHEIEKLAEELIEADTVVYFPEDRLKVVPLREETGPSIAIQPMTTAKDWQEALAQRKDFHPGGGRGGQ